MKGRRKRKQMMIVARGVIIIIIILLIVIISFIGRSITNRIDRLNLHQYLDSTQRISYRSVVIQEGDTMSSISRDICEEYSMEVPTDVMIYNICSINNLGNADVINEGCYLIVPYFVDDK